MTIRVGMIAISLSVWAAGHGVWAGTTIDSEHPYAYGANIGWLNAQGDVTSGAVLGQYFCTGYLWSANCGWISLGNGPTNGWQYGNAAANDWGVNHDGLGHLTGHAYGANIGWLTFEQTHGQPKIDLLTGNLSGYVWSGNIGWISLSNVQAFVKTETLDAGPDTDGDGIPDAYEYKWTGNLSTLGGGGADYDGDLMPDEDEYYADTNPTDASSLLHFTEYSLHSSTNRFTWTTAATRFYQLQSSTNLQVAAFTNSEPDLLVSEGETLTRELASPQDQAVYYRVKGVVPLSP